MTDYFQTECYQEAFEYIKSKLPSSFPKVYMGIVCGSGLGTLAEGLEGETYELSYSDIPHFVNSTDGHAGKLVFGYLSKKPVVLMVGRKHYYEGHKPVQTVFGIRIMKLLGAEILLTTNAAGGLNSDFKVGDVMLISDHVSFAGMAGINALIGPNVKSFGPRFPPTSNAYDFDLRVLMAKAAYLSGLPTNVLREGVYVFLTGPSFETRAEARFLRDSCKGDCVGMSTVPEVVVARHCGMKVVGLSLITNKVSVSHGRSALSKAYADLNVPYHSTETCHDDEEQVASHEEVLETSRHRSYEIQAIVRKFIELL